jgi:hypothetical protein
MDVPPIADATPEPLVTPPAPLPDAERRLANVEAALAEMNERLDALAVSLEASLREAVTHEVRQVSGELRHTVAELGRLLVRDLGKLSKLLSEHRDAIVAELGGPTPRSTMVGAPIPSPTVVTAPGGDGDPSPESTGALVEDEPLLAEPQSHTDDGAVDGVADGERQRRSLLRRRHG